MSRSTEYAQKLRDPRWQRLSAVVKERAEWKCQRCGATDKTLHAHHRMYRSGVEPWDYHPCDLECLCWDCHERVEKLLNKLRWAVCDMECDEIVRVIKYAIRSNKWKRIPLTKARELELKEEYTLR